MAFKMNGWSGYQNSPLKKEKSKKTQSTKEDAPDYQAPIQPAENPDLAITGGSKFERIADLEDRIGFLNEKYSEYDRPLTDAEKKSMKVLKDRLKKERAE